jgi:hypothetical protein
MTYGIRHPLAGYGDSHPSPLETGELGEMGEGRPLPMRRRDRIQSGLPRLAPPVGPLRRRKGKRPLNKRIRKKKRDQKTFGTAAHSKNARRRERWADAIRKDIRRFYTREIVRDLIYKENPLCFSTDGI